MGRGWTECDDKGVEMANVKFTKDEVILALDVLYCSKGKHLGPHSKEIIKLSEDLNMLPIYPEEKRPANFRNCVGVSHQIDRFLRGITEGRSSWNVGEAFFRVDFEYRNNKEKLHAIAEAIRRNAPLLRDYQFGDCLEDNGFPEGIILGHLHRIVEQRDSRKISLSERCDICQLVPNDVYKPCGTLIEHHLTVAPECIDYKNTYRENSFISVCPNCHAALHKYRPWVEKNACCELLK